jgi:hypothetical protein
MYTVFLIGNLRELDILQDLRVDGADISREGGTEREARCGWIYFLTAD